jgi:hypothetical protein
MQKRHSRLLALSFLGAAMASLPSANAQQIPVPVGGMGQHIVARNVLGISCTNPFTGTAANPTPNLTSHGTAVLYFPYIAGIPDQYLFSTTDKTMQDEKHALFTAVFSRVEAWQTHNGSMTDTFLDNHYIYYYYHPDSSPSSFADINGFKAGTLIGIYHVQKNMFSQINNFSLVVNSGPFTYTRDFTLPNGQVINLVDLMPGGITVTVLGNIGVPETNPGPGPGTGTPVFAFPGLTLPDGPLGTATKPFGDTPDEFCALMSPFSGSGTNPAPVERGRGGH